MKGTKQIQRLISFAAVILLFSAACSRPPARNDQPSRPTVEASGAQTLTGRVVRVADGDTVTVLDSTDTQHKIRLEGIDAPESHQAFGTQSKQNLSQMVFDKDVTVIFQKTDQYGRLVGKILLDGKDINLEQVKAGMAWHYREYQREQAPEDRELYAKAEDEARAARRGLWQDADPVEPGAFRKEEKRDRQGAR
ncbi:MAG: thermonuclease family protein [Acidobacteriota bacterium]|nr:thermonuclease family protein [Acidobacteriota bacterium]